MIMLSRLGKFSLVAPVSFILLAFASSSAVFGSSLTEFQTKQGESQASALPSLERDVSEGDNLYFAQQAEPIKPANASGQAENQTKIQLTPLETAPIRLFNLETANQLPAGAFNTTAGLRFFTRGGNQGGIGTQVYHGQIEAGVTNKLQLGGHILSFDDPLSGLNNGPDRLGLFILAPQAKYQVLNREKLKLGVSGSVEFIRVVTSNGLFKPAIPANELQTNTVAGTLEVPISYNLTPNLQWHVTPGVAFFPSTINNGGDFYGTFLHLGTGFSWQVVKRLALFADVNFPFGPGNNAVRSNLELYRQIVWSGGGRFLVSPALALDLYATNSFGQTPATRVLSFIPGGGRVAVGLNASYTPDFFHNYPSSFRPRETPLTFRDYQLMLDGITLTSANTLSKGNVFANIGVGAGSDFRLAYGLTDDAQLAFIGQSFSDDGNVPGYGPSLKLGAEGKFRFWDQSKGDPISVALQAAFGQSTTESNIDGVSSAAASAIFSYQLNPRIAFTFNPKFGAFSSARLFGTGFGVNADIYKGIQIIGEVTPRFTGVNKEPVWSVGLRYQDEKTGLGLDLYGTNAIGRNLVGGLIAEDRNTNIGFNVHWLGNRQK